MKSIADVNRLQSESNRYSKRSLAQCKKVEMARIRKEIGGMLNEIRLNRALKSRWVRKNYRIAGWIPLHKLQVLVTIIRDDFRKIQPTARP